MGLGSTQHPEIGQKQIELVDALKQMKEWTDKEADRDRVELGEIKALRTEVRELAEFVKKSIRNVTIGFVLLASIVIISAITAKAQLSAPVIFTPTPPTLGTPCTNPVQLFDKTNVGSFTQCVGGVWTNVSVGTVGPTGAQGATGPQGATGSTGSTGATGTAGITAGTSVSLTSGTAQMFVCTGTCTITVPIPAQGAQYCVFNDNNIATVITFSAIGSSAMYENTARTAYGTAGTGTFVSSGAVGDLACLTFRDSTHYNTTTYKGTWTAN